MAGTPYTLQVNKKTTISGDFAAGATSLTLASAAFSNFTGGYLVIDYDIDAKIEVIKCTVTGTAVTGITRGQDSTSDVLHSSGAKIGFMFVPGHYEGLKPQTVGSDTFSATNVSSTTFASIGMNRSFTTTGGKVKATFTVGARTGTAGDFFQFRLKRGATVLRTSGNVGGGAAANERFYATFTNVESPAAGAYTYDIEINRASGSGTITLEDANLLLEESAI